MFYLSKDAKFQGHTDCGLAIYAVDRPGRVAAPAPVRRAPKLDAAKLAKARADRARVNALIGELA